MEKHVWGQTPDGEDVVVYELTGTNGMRASVMNYGANLLTLFVPDKNRDCKDIVLGYEHLEDYFTNDAFFGCSVVPCGNRIGDAKFTLNGKTYELDKNDGVNNLHSGFHPLCRRIWMSMPYPKTASLFLIRRRIWIWDFRETQPIP